MAKWFRWNWRDVFDMSRRERDGVLVILVLMYSVLYAPDVFMYFRSKKLETFWDKLPAETRHWIDSVQLEFRNADSLFYFDPNTTEEREWLALGVPLSVARRVNSRVDYGRRIEEPEELLEVYGFSERDFVRLRNWIRIKPAIVRKKPTKKQWKRTAGPANVQEVPVDSLEINGAAVSDFERLPGLGKVLATRAVRFREKLGGYHGVEQFGELYGLDPEVFTSIRSMLYCTGAVQKIRLDTAGEATLKRHPYIAPWTAEYIVEYRELHNGFVSLDELRKVTSVTDSVYQRILPYLELAND